MRGQDLDALIENELQFMLLEGFEKAPISAKALHTRLKTKSSSKVETYNGKSKFIKFIRA